jgi:hypothetical protein
MNPFKKIFGSRQKAEDMSEVDLWEWFPRHAAEFLRIIKANDQVDEKFLGKIMPRLQSMNDQFYCVVGMYDSDTAELVITAEGDVKSFVFVEELVGRAPAVQGWKFTALNPPTNMTSSRLSINGYEFDSNNIRFYYDDDAAYPDNINISLLYDQYSEQDEKLIQQGSLLFLENSLGEMNTATQIDDLIVAAACPDGKEPIPIGKLEDFLIWREKELIEKYEGTHHGSENDLYSIMEAQDNDGLPVLASIKCELLEWELKASHPWMMVIEITYDGKKRKGLPGDDTLTAMNLFEDILEQQLPGHEGYLNLGRQTYNGTRIIYFACKEFRRSSKTAAALIHQHQGRLTMTYDIYKDKYWMSLNRFRDEA